MEFDRNGYLQPHEIIFADLQQIEMIFVDGFTDSTVRSKIFKNYIRYTEAIRKLVGEPFHQWIDGSFVTKKENPNDIDVLTFIPVSSFNKNWKEFEMLRRWRFNRDFCVDGYFIKIVPEEHPDHRIYNLDKQDWLSTFTTDHRFNNKGVIQINF